ncbi:hypothetical protein CGZ75_18315 [Paenibacillus herberti]|uniref:Uncharacterized protein n=1 Tax=Paenibacillus herberti TaxID=1619309 RepID=A0A229NYJ8_9BACL|nr:hypothetical protein CGZ75_18315 [Paenibacillus herberti]
MSCSPCSCGRGGELTPCGRFDTLSILEALLGWQGENDFEKSTYERLFKKAPIDHEVKQEADSTSNLVFTFEVRCSCRFANLLLPVHTTFSVLNGDLFELAL